MTTLTPKNILASFVVTAASTVGGGAITNKLAGPEAEYSFLRLGLVAISVILALQIIFCCLRRRKVLYQLLFAIAFTSAITWFMLCLVLPLFWLETLTQGKKLLILLFLFLLSICNAAEGARQFNRKWRTTGQKLFDQHYNSSTSEIEWQKVVKPMGLSIQLYIPGVSEIVTHLLSIVLFLSMLAGLNLRHPLPVFSAFAWGLPSCVIISIFVQMIGLGIAQIAVISKLEKEIGKPIRPKR
jgi:hypothetical protein